MEKKVLITGSSSGFGKMTALSLLSKGHKVAASMRGVDGKNKAVAEELSNAGATVVEIDVTIDESVANGVQAAIDALGGLDVVINNAGLGVIGMQEHFTPEDFQHCFNINVFGVQRVCRAVIPHFRAQQSGLIIYVSSTLGRHTLPFFGPYNASKWALEGMAENYRSELSAFNIESAIVEPGGFMTGFIGALARPSDDSRAAAYGDYNNVPEQMIGGFAQVLESNPQQDPQLVSDAMVGLVEMPSGQRPFRTVVDKMGLEEPLAGYNKHLSQMTNAVYEGYNMSDMLKLNAED